MIRIGIIDYKAGNAPSVFNALKKIGVEAVLLAEPREAENVTALILPGVGSARATMESLAEKNWIAALDDMVLKRGLPFLGICVGMQILFDHSEEEDTDCFSWISGKVERFSPDKIRVPQMGWNGVNWRLEHPLLDGIDNPEYFYFVNSYYVKPEDDRLIFATTDYGTDFCSAVVCRNIAATQFHLEKSGEAGLRLLKNFTEWRV